jgi:hypothetical protein
VSDGLQNFADVARRYCAWCEGIPGDAETEARTAVELLVQLMRAIAPVELGAGGGDAPGISNEDWQQMYARFASMPFRYYRAEFDPLNIDDTERGMGDVADDLADIWRDLKEGLSLYDVNDLAGAAWEWRFNFDHHWGRHTTSALYPLHCWLADNGGL